MLKRGSSSNRGDIPAMVFAINLLCHVRDVSNIYRQLNVPPPAAMFLSFLNVRDQLIRCSDSMGLSARGSFDRNDVLIPGSVVEDFTLNPAEICKPLLDAFWNAAGQESWPHYNEMFGKFAKAR